MLQLSGRAVGLAAAGALVAGCTTAVTQPPPAPVVDPVNLDPLKLTIDMIRFDTSHNGEGGVTVPHAEMLKSPPGSVEPVVVTLTRQDKTSAALELVAQGTTTHSSRPSPDAAITRLNRAAVRLADYQPGVGLTDVTRPYFQAWASRTDNPKLAAALRLMLNASEQAERDRAGASADFAIDKDAGQACPQR